MHKETKMTTAAPTYYLTVLPAARVAAVDVLAAAKADRAASSRRYNAFIRAKTRQLDGRSCGACGASAAAQDPHALNRSGVCRQCGAPSAPAGSVTP